MNWLISPGNRLISFNNEIGLLKELHKLHQAGGHLEDVFNTVISDPENPLTKLLNEALDLDTSRFPQELRFLGKRFGDLAGSKPNYTWTVLNNEPETSGKLGSVLLGLKGGAKASILLAVNNTDKLPESVKTALEERNSLSLSFMGSLFLGASASLQANFVKVSASTEACVEAQFDYFFGHDDGDFISGALLRDLPKLHTSPFEVKTLHDQLADETNLHGLRIQLDGKLSLGGKVGFAATTNLTSGTAGKLNIAADFGFTLSESDSFEYLVTRDKLDSSCILVELKRGRASARQTNESLSIGIDLSGWAARVYPEITEHLTDAGEFLKKFQEYLPEKDPLGNALGKVLNEILSGSEWEKEIKSLLGFSKDTPFSKVMEQRIANVLSNTTGGWKKDVKAGAEAVFAEVAADLGLPQDIVSGVQSEAEAAFEKILGQLQETLKGRSAEIIGSTGWNGVLDQGDKLAKKIDASIADADERINALTESVRHELDAIQKRLNALAKPLEDASKAKIALAFEAMRREEQGKELDIRFAIDASRDDDEADTVLQSLLKGDIGPYLLDTAKRSPAVKRVSGTFKRYRSIQEQDHFNVVLFNLGFSGTTKVKIDSSITVDAQGNLVLLSNQEWQKILTRGTDERTLKVTNALEVAAASASTDITVGFAFTLVDKNLESTELEAFMRPIENIGLLPAGTTNKGMALLGASHPNAQLDMSLALTSSQFNRFLGRQPMEVLRTGAVVFQELLGPLPPDPTFVTRMNALVEKLSDKWHTRIGGIADAIVHYSPENAQSAQGIDAGDEGLGEFSSDRLRFWLADRYKGLAGRPAYSEQDPNNEYSEIGLGEMIHHEAEPGFKDVISELGLLKAFELPADLGKDAAAQDKLLEEVNGHQQRINKALRNWYGTSGDAAWWVFGKKSPRLINLAMLVLVARLSAVDDQPRGWPLLSAALTYVGPQGKKRESLT